MTPIQQLMLGVGISEKTYLDDIFATTLYVGNEGSKTVTTGIDLATDGGLVIGKSRAGAHAPFFYDTTRGVQKYLRGDNNDAETTLSTGLTAFSTTGFSVGSHVGMNDDVKNAAWSLKKTPGFFDIVTYTGTGSARTVSHNLNSIPGCIMVKRTDGGSEDWVVYHRGMSDQLGNNPGHYFMYLNETNTYSAAQSRFNNVAATSTEFSVGTDNGTNGNGFSYVAYLFAGGESTAATARSVDFDGTDDTLTLAPSDDFHMTGDFTIEGWFNPDSWPTYAGFWGLGQYNDPGGIFFGVVASTGKLDMQKANNTGGGYSTPFSQDAPPLGQWTHVALVRSGSTITVYYNGTAKGSWTDSTDWGTSTNKWFNIASVRNGSGNNVDFFNGQVSNVRVVKGTAVYTSNFRVPTEPLTNITNTKLLCCNGSSTTSSTVTPGTITAAGGPTASSDSPFDDPAGFKFGDSKEGVIKCGSYKGGGSAGFKVNIGWEPSWLMIKSISTAGDWYIVDSMRGVATGGTDEFLKANSHSAGDSSYNVIDFTSTGFQVNVTGSHWNSSTHTYSFIAIRRVDGYVGKPVEDATKVFAMDTGAGSSTIPNFDSTFPVDFALRKNTNNSGTNWRIAARLIQGKFLEANNTNAISTSADLAAFDSNVGFGQDGADTNYQAWMFKRHAGFDVVTYKGDAVMGRAIPHSMNSIPEMIWVKKRDGTTNWMAYHKSVTTPDPTGAENYLYLNTNAAAANSEYAWFDTTPTSTHVFLGASGELNGNNNDFMMVLFSSVDGISKCGGYTGTGSSFSVTCGFQPRFLIIRRTDSANDWRVFDTGRGWTSSDNNMMILNGNGTEDSGNYVNHNSTGFTLTTSADVNASSGKYIYYAHA